ncbi:hypothetical protein FS749_014532, partial [Ceratobasidium sp. UAMH 11750]
MDRAAYDRTHWERTEPHPFATPPVRTAPLRSSNESLSSTSRRGPPPFSPPRRDPPQTPSSTRPPSSRRALTAALELAQEAVRIDSSGTEPLAAIAAYGKSVALLNEVMERVMRGEGADRRRSGVRRRSDAAREDEVRRLKSIHDTYADRMQILSLIYNMGSGPPDDTSPDYSPHVPPTPPPLYAPAHEPAGDYEQSSGFYPIDHAPAFLVHDEDEEEEDDMPTSAENIGSAFASLENPPSLDYNSRDYLATTREYASSRDHRGYSSAPPSRDYTPSPHRDYESDQPTPTDPVQTPVSPTSTITPQRVSVLPPPRPPPTGPPPTLPQPTGPSTHAFAQPAYALPQPPMPQPQARVNGASMGALPAPPKPVLTRTQSAGPGLGSTSTVPRTDPHSPLRRSYIVPHSQPQTQPLPVQQSRSRSGSVAGHKRSGSGNERLGTLSEERERERSEGGNQSASSGNESESWTVVGAEAYSHQQPVAEGYRPTSAYRSRVASSARELPPLPADGSPLTPRVPGGGSGGDVVQRPRGDTESSASSRGSDGPSSAGTVSTAPTNLSVVADKMGTQVAGVQAQTSGMLVSPSTAQGSIALRRKSAQPSIGQAMAFEQALQSPPQPIQQPPV